MAAQEDLLSKLNLLLTQKQDQEDTDDNTVLFKITAPQDIIDEIDAGVTATHPAISNEVWGGYDNNGVWHEPNWRWGQGQWL